MSLKFASLLLSAVLICSTRAADLFGIPEIPVPDLPDVAIASFDMMGNPVIYFNPVTTSQLGAKVCCFIRAHEYAHHKFRHAQRQMYATNMYEMVQFSREGEIAADRFAAEYWAKKDSTVVTAFIAALKHPAIANMGDLTHLASADRVKLIEGYLKTSKKKPPTDDSEDADSGIEGTWAGTPEGLNIPLIFEVESEDDVTAKSPLQHTSAPATVKVTGKKVKFTIPSAGVTITGTINGTTIVGTFKQKGQSFPITLEKED